MKVKSLLKISAIFILSSCSGEPETLKSPCVGSYGSPCDNRSPVNLHMKDQYTPELQRKLFV